MLSTLDPTTPADYAEMARRPLDPEQCALIVVDIQSKLLPPIFHKDDLIRNSQLLIRAAGILKIPSLVSTQYAKGLGETVPEIASLLPQTEAIDKQLFSCFGSDVRNPDRPGGAAQGISGSRCIRRRGFAYGVELENRPGEDAGRERGDLIDGDDHLRTDEVFRLRGIQGTVAVFEGIEASFASDATAAFTDVMA